MLFRKNNKHNWFYLNAVIFFIALIVRLIHNRYLMESPLYFMPLGGHLPYIVMAEKIAAGNIIPFDAPFSLNSPLYPYILGLVYYLAGIGQLFVARLFSIVFDSITCVIAAVLAKRYFGKVAGIIAGLITAFSGPMIFYSAELIVVPYTLFFVILSIYILDMDHSAGSYLLSGILLGIAVDTRPNLLILAIIIIWTPYLLRREKRLWKSLFLCLGIILTILPITIANYYVSGKFVLLTTSFGHNFYIGHNPSSNAGYNLPQSLDGDIFSNMKILAEKIESRTFEDTEVSTYYIKKAFGNIINNPIRELRNTGEKFLASINDYEATTYANYYFQKELSPILAYSISFGLLFPLAALGIIFHFKRHLLLMPVIASFITIILFFYISRLRMPMVPFLAILSSGAIVTTIEYVKNRKMSKILLTIILLIGFGFLSNIRLTEVDTSNEWNKVGIILRAQKKYQDAEKAFLKALNENNNNPNTYLNLSVLYTDTGNIQKALEMKVKGEQLKDTIRENIFINHLYGKSD